YPGAGQHVAGDRKAGVLDVSAPVDTFASGMGGDVAAGIHDVKLPAVAAVVGSDQACNDLARAEPLAQQLQAVDAVIGIDQGLGRDRTDAGGDIGHARADGEEPGRDRNPELAGLLVTSDDRPCHRWCPLSSRRIALHAAWIGGRASSAADPGGGGETALRPARADLDDMTAVLQI